ncbi:MAG: formylglycine-generating enzyme family protein, partial [Leptolyngbya sp. SIO4C5]|nr:formylglycine-generating enzyme family protein [Leptolyngbya sp. SIO4C5]
MVASNRRRPPKDLVEQRVSAFEQRYGRQATNLAAHAAFPLTLTTDVVYCLRETFLSDCPWYATADVLLSGLCVPAGYDLYEMEAATRRYLLRYLGDQFGETRILELERFMVAYLRHRLIRENPDERALLLGEKPHWTSLACLKPGEAYEEIRQTLEQLALQGAEDPDRFRLASLVESYGDFLADRGYQPILIDWSDRVAEGQPIDETADIAGRLKNSGFAVSWVAFEVATIAFGAPEAPEAPAADLISIGVNIVTVNDQGEVIDSATHQAFYFEEPLA